MTGTFTEFWEKFPRKRAKKDALKAYTAARKRYSHEAIMASLEIMTRTEWRERKPEYVPYPATFLRGEDFEERCELIEDEQEYAFGEHLCDVCRPAHVWQEDGDRLNWSTEWKRACPKQVQAMKQAIGGRA